MALSFIYTVTYVEQYDGRPRTVLGITTDLQQAIDHATKLGQIELDHAAAQAKRFGEPHVMHITFEESAIPQDSIDPDARMYMRVVYRVRLWHRDEQVYPDYEWEVRRYLSPCFCTEGHWRKEV